MVLYLIGAGLWDAKDISIRAREILGKCSRVYLESYTSLLHCGIEEIEKEWKVKVVPVGREFVESGEEIMKEAKEGDVAVVVIGDVFAATTHAGLFLEAKKRKIKTQVIHNASILTAVGITGLELYKFGRTASIPFDSKNIVAPIEVFRKNFSIGLHTLFLLDLSPAESRYLTASEASDYLIKNGIDKDIKAIACAALGGPNPILIAGTLEELREKKVEQFPQCVIIPGKLHFIEEEMLEGIAE